MLSSAQLFEASQNELDHDRLVALINSLYEGFLAISPAGLIELSNGVALNLLDTNSLIGKKLSEAMPLLNATDEFVDPFSLITESNSNFSSRDLRLKYTDGTTINLFVNISAVKAGYGKSTSGGFVILFRDITKEVSAEEDRDEFISVASHELRNPVAIVEGSISNAILLASKAEVPGNLVPMLRSAHEQTVFLSNLINDLAMVSRSDRGKLTEPPAEFDVVELVNSLRADYLASAEKKGLGITISGGDIPKIHGSRLYTREILQNFITNAIKYTEKGGISIELKSGPNGASISVSDSGIGIDQSEQAKLFTKFFRSGDSRVTQASGTGLGLYVALKLAKIIEGSIEVSSHLNHGSVFTLHLPYSMKTPQPPKKS